MIRQFVVVGDVDPDRVCILGASHGGYGAFVIGPKMPDRFAAIHASAAAPTDGETHGENLKHFYWLEAPHPSSSGRIEASVHDNTITLKAEHQDALALCLDCSLVDLDRPITIEPDGGSRQVIKAKVNPETFCVGLEERGDPRLAAPARVSVKLRP